VVCHENVFMPIQQRYMYISDSGGRGQNLPR
jgi:hypothetical protein